jgi:hypothetical protein
MFLKKPNSLLQLGCSPGEHATVTSPLGSSKGRSRAEGSPDRPLQASPPVGRARQSEVTSTPPFSLTHVDNASGRARVRAVGKLDPVVATAGGRPAPLIARVKACHRSPCGGGSPKRRCITFDSHFLRTHLHTCH